MLLSESGKRRLNLIDRCAIVVILLCVGQIIFALTGKIGFANNVRAVNEPNVDKNMIDWGRSFWTILEWNNDPEVTLKDWTIFKAIVLFISYYVIAFINMVAWLISVKKNKGNIILLILPVIAVAPIIFDSIYHSACYIIAPCQIYSLIIMVIEMGLATYVLIEEKKLQRKGR